MKPQKITVEYYSESDVCEAEIMTITANSTLMNLDEYFITITSETGISFNDKEELMQIVDNLISVVEQTKKNICES